MKKNWTYFIIIISTLSMLSCKQIEDDETTVKQVYLSDLKNKLSKSQSDIYDLKQELVRLKGNSKSKIKDSSKTQEITKDSTKAQETIKDSSKTQKTIDKIDGIYEVYEATSNTTYNTNKLKYLVRLAPIERLMYISVYTSGNENYDYEEISENEIGFKALNYNNEGKTWQFQAKGDNDFIIISGISQDRDSRLGGSIIPLNGNMDKLLVTGTMRDMLRSNKAETRRRDPKINKEVWVKRKSLKKKKQP